MIKIPKDVWGNDGWAVKARKTFTCEGYQSGRRIQPGEYYYRAIAWPRSDVNPGKAPWIIRLCRDCLDDARRAMFDAAIEQASQRKVAGGAQ